MLAAAIGSLLFVYILWPSTPLQSSREWIIVVMPDNSIQLTTRHRPWAERLYSGQVTQIKTETNAPPSCIAGMFIVHIHYSVDE